MSLCQRGSPIPPVCSKPTTPTPTRTFWFVVAPETTAAHADKSSVARREGSARMKKPRKGERGSVSSEGACR